MRILSAVMDLITEHTANRNVFTLVKSVVFFFAFFNLLISKGEKMFKIALIDELFMKFDPDRMKRNVN